MLDLTSGVPDKAWLGTQKAVGTYVAGKADSGMDAITVARGEGRSGGDCLLVTSPDAKAGLPGFWVMRGRGNGRGSVANVKTDEGYLADSRVNRLSFWLRFDAGFRATSSAASACNFVVGTYHFDPALKGDRKESNNWHFYHQLVLRHDRAQDGWIHVVLNDIPQHQRSLSKYSVPANPTQPAGDYWNLLTRFYLDCHPYMSAAEIPHPIRMLVDDMQLTYVDPITPATLTLPKSQATIVRGQTTTFAVELRNRTGAPLTGRVGHRSHYSWTPALIDPGTRKSVHDQRIALAAYESRTLELSFTPRETHRSGTSLPHGVVFTPSTDDRPENHSLADANVLLHRTYGVSGPCDSSPAYANIRLTIA